MVRSFTIVASLFFCGSFLGWVMEVFYRRFVSHRKEGKWINPGFLTGPYLPIYGFGLVGLYLLKQYLLPLFPDETAGAVVTLVVMAFSMTIIEYIGGLIFIKGMGIKLWDYSDQWGNIQGIICPLYSFFWAAVAIVYFFLIDPFAVRWVEWISSHMESLFFIGLFGGIFLVDFWNSVDLSVKIRRFAKENKIIVKYEELKASVRDFWKETHERAHFLRFFHVRDFRENLSRYLREQDEKYKKFKEEQSRKSLARKLKK